MDKYSCEMKPTRYFDISKCQLFAAASQTYQNNFVAFSRSHHLLEQNGRRIENVDHKPGGLGTLK